MDRIDAARRRIEEAVGIEPIEPMSGIDADGEYWERTDTRDEPDTLTLTRAVVELAAVLEASGDSAAVLLSAN